MDAAPGTGINRAAAAGTMALLELMRKALPEGIALDHVLIDSNLCVIISGEKRDARREIEQGLSALRRTAFEKFGLDIPMGVSAAAETVDGLPGLYLQSVEAMEYIQLLGLRDIVFYEDISDAPCALSDWFDDAEERIKLSVQAMEFDVAKQLIGEFYDKMNNSHVSLQILQCRFFGILNAMLTVFSSLSEQGKSRIVSHLRPAERLFSCQNTTACKETLLELLDDIARMVHTDVLEKQQTLLDSIRREIDKQYLDPNLSVGRIADNLQMNVTYLSKFFKTETGTGMLEYIHRKRIGYAKSIMRDNDLSITEVSGMSGFHNDLTFTRVFKKYENITPGQYSKIKERST